MNGKIAAYFTDVVSNLDCEILAQQRGTSEAQQAFESLALLVAFRLLLSALTGAGTLIAREFALDLVQCTRTPPSLYHLPGVSNVFADRLSLCST